MRQLLASLRLLFGERLRLAWMLALPTNVAERRPPVRTYRTNPVLRTFNAQVRLALSAFRLVFWFTAAAVVRP